MSPTRHPAHTAFLLGAPYLSPPLAEHIRTHNAPVVALDELGHRQAADHGLTLTDAQDFIDDYCRSPHPPLLLSVSPQAPGWIKEHLAGTPLAAQVATLDDKVAFRNSVADLYPDFVFRAVDPREPGKPTMLPALVKPAHGFGGAGAKKVDDEGQWYSHHRTLADEDCTVAIAESVLPGTEYAADFVLDARRRPRLVTVLERLSPTDNLTYLYRTDTELLARMGRAIAHELRRTAEHLHFVPMTGVAEYRADEHGRLVPVEINPCRFGAWGTADVSAYAYGSDPYNHLTPNEPTLVGPRAHRTSHLVAFVDRPYPPPLTVQHDLLAPTACETDEIRPVDHTSWPFLAALFMHTTNPDDYDRTVETLRRGAPKEALADHDRRTP
ncbi:ATP-grasp domain-containing protein [Streptomyces xanthochromogenes]|uniref:ATP-grasp domain-containing protein n=1 Tax=Streptomyces xanthochromogenes TaxID=67384 RepID=UPI0038272EE0